MKTTIKCKGFEIIILETEDGFLATINDVFHTGCTGDYKPTMAEAAEDALRYFGECFDDVPFPYNEARRVIVEMRK